MALMLVPTEENTLPCTTNTHFAMCYLTFTVDLCTLTDRKNLCIVTNIRGFNGEIK